MCDNKLVRHGSRNWQKLQNTPVRDTDVEDAISYLESPFVTAHPWKNGRLSKDPFLYNSDWFLSNVTSEKSNIELNRKACAVQTEIRTFTKSLASACFCLLPDCWTKETKTLGKQRFKFTLGYTWRLELLVTRAIRDSVWQSCNFRKVLPECLLYSEKKNVFLFTWTLHTRILTESSDSHCKHW